jgi:hypothetical protein
MTSMTAHFPMDSDMSFDDYLNQLRELAANEELETRIKAGRFDGGQVQYVVDNATKKSTEFLEPQHYIPDLSYYYAWMALNCAAGWHEYAKEPGHRCPEDVKKHARALLTGAMKTAEVLQTTHLPPLFCKQLAVVKAAMPERDRLRRLQMEGVDDDCGKIGDKSAQHVEEALATGGGGVPSSSASEAGGHFERDDDAELFLAGVALVPPGAGETRDAAGLRRQQLQEEEKRRLAEFSAQNLLAFSLDAGGLVPPPPPPDLPPPPPPPT